MFGAFTSPQLQDRDPGPDPHHRGAQRHRFGNLADADPLAGSDEGLGDDQPRAPLQALEQIRFVYGVRLARITSHLHADKRHRRPQIPSRELGFRKPPLKRKRGRRNAERRTLVTAAACFPDRRETEAHGNASRRSVAAIFLASVRSPGDLGGPCGLEHGDFAPLRLSPSSQLQWQCPVMGPDGNPRPPECAERRPPHARRRRSHPHVPKRPR